MTRATRSTFAYRTTSSKRFGKRRRYSRRASTATSVPILFRNLKQSATAGLIAFVPEQFVHGSQVKVHLAGVFGLERPDLELDHHEATQSQVVEQQVQVVVLPADLHVVLAPHQREAHAKLEEEISDVREQ